MKLSNPRFSSDMTLSLLQINKWQISNSINKYKLLHCDTYSRVFYATEGIFLVCYST